MTDSVPAPHADPQLVSRLREDLRAAEWTTDAVSALLSQCAQDALGRDQLTPARVELAQCTSAAALLTRLFILAEVLEKREIVAAFPALGIDGATSLGLVGSVPCTDPLEVPVKGDSARIGAREARDRRGEAVGAEVPMARGTRYRALVDLRPHSASLPDADHSWWVASDLSQAQTGAAPAEDHVLGIAAATTNLLRQTVRSSSGSALDLGCGCGILALYLTTHVSRVVATDISQRACEFTRFNSLLNEVEIDVRQGSLFEPVEGETFDLITSNPPFVITPEAIRQRVSLEYRDGGLPRDTLIPLILQQGLQHLDDGGTLQMLANWEVGADETQWDRNPVAWIRQAATTVANHGGRADAWVVQRDLVDVAQYAEWWMRDQWGDRAEPSAWRAEYEEWISDFRRAGTSYVGLGSIVVRVFYDDSSRPTADGNAAAGALSLVTEFLPDGPGIDGRAVQTALGALSIPAGWREQAFVRSPDVREVRYYVPGTSDPEMIRLTQGAAGGRDRPVSSVVAAFVGVCDGELAARQVIPAIALLMDRSEAEAWAEIEEALPELLRSGVLRPDLLTGTSG